MPFARPPTKPQPPLARDYSGQNWQRLLPDPHIHCYPVEVLKGYARYLLFLDMRSYLSMGIGIPMLIHSLYLNSYIGKA
jgi:hypothetical protein